MLHQNNPRWATILNVLTDWVYRSQEFSSCVWNLWCDQGVQSVKTQFTFLTFDPRWSQRPFSFLVSSSLWVANCLYSFLLWGWVVYSSSLVLFSKRIHLRVSARTIFHLHLLQHQRPWPRCYIFMSASILWAGVSIGFGRLPNRCDRVFIRSIRSAPLGVCLWHLPNAHTSLRSCVGQLFTMAMEYVLTSLTPIALFLWSKFRLRRVQGHANDDYQVEVQNLLPIRNDKHHWNGSFLFVRGLRVSIYFRVLMRV